MKCNQCGMDFLLWEQEDENDEIEAVALALGTICQPCFKVSETEFLKMRARADNLRAQGIDEKMVSRMISAWQSRKGKKDE